MADFSDDPREQLRYSYYAELEELVRAYKKLRTTKYQAYIAARKPEDAKHKADRAALKTKYVKLGMTPRYKP